MYQGPSTRTTDPEGSPRSWTTDPSGPEDSPRSQTTSTPSPAPTLDLQILTRGRRIRDFPAKIPKTTFCTGVNPTWPASAIYVAKLKPAQKGISTAFNNILLKAGTESDEF